ncbi:clarin-3 [Anabas testudineus]|uniref:Clarin 3 n=1 Tax=Anabas testudineus TaxID=64144 RepID=A0A3Q1IDG7_ANATE|nr:clarin-3 [Anabas testudineus]
MPSIQKMLFFISSALVTAVSVGLLGYGMSANWATTTIECARSGSGHFNGSAKITMTLFNGTVLRTFCPFGGSDRFDVFPALTTKGGTPIALHGLVLCLLGLCLLFSACTILISLYNSVSNPYETYMGPVGIYTCSSLSACFSFAVLIIFFVNVTVTNMAQDVVMSFAGVVDLGDKSSNMLQGYYFVIPYTVLALFDIALIFLYDHAAYTHRREQQRPTEDAPKEIMMY